MSTPPDRLTQTAAQRAESRAQAQARLRRRRILAGLGVVAIIATPVAAVGLLSLDKHNKHDGKHASSSQPAKKPASPAGTSTTSSSGVAATPAGNGSQASVPILMYHVLNAPKPDTPLPDLWVSKENFQAQVDALAKAGYQAVTLQRVYDAWKGKGSLPKKPIVLTFDDGYHSHFTNAMPILKAKHWPGVEFLQINQTQEDLKPDEVKALIAAGWEIDAHTYTHPDLTTVDATQLKHEVGDSRTEIQKTYGVKARFFAYPSGKFDPTVEAAVKAAGYLGATTTVDGVASPDSEPFQLQRIRVNGSDSLKTFTDKVEVGGFNTGQAAQE